MPVAEKQAPAAPPSPAVVAPEIALTAEATPAPPSAAPPEDLRLREGDVVQVSFPGAPSLNTQQQVRRDGKITLPIVGDVMAADLTPDQLKKKLTDLYAPQLVWKEVLVTVVSSQYPVFVSGAVLRPGKIMTDRPMTALEAIMEAGGFDTTKANVGAVVVIRNEDGKTRNFTLDMKTALEGKETTPFYLKPSDIVYVPAKFSWF